MGEVNPLVRGLTEKSAETSPGAEDPRLRGRTYTIPFNDVWETSLHVIRKRLRGWTVVIDNDREGRIDALATSPLRGLETEVVVRIGLDENGQTRVDLETTTRTDVRDYGRCRRLIGHFTKRLDKELDPRPGQVLDPTAMPRFHTST